MEYLVIPQVEDAVKFIRSHLSTHVLVINAVASVSYSGRAKASLVANSYLIISKPDGTFMVHGYKREKPLVWNPPGSKLYVSGRDGSVELLSIRTSPPERVNAILSSVKFVGAFEVDHVDNKVVGTESDLVDWLVGNPGFIEEGLTILEREHDTMVGRIDILGRDAKGRLVVIEVKRSQAGPDAVNQLRRYVDHIHRRRGEKPRGILVSPDISASAHFMLKSSGLEYVKISKDLTMLAEKQGRGNFNPWM